MSCAAKIPDPLVIDLVLGTQSDPGGALGTVTVGVHISIPSALLRVTLQMFPRGSGGLPLTKLNYNLFSGSFWFGFGVSDTSPAEDLNQIFTGRTIPDSWELQTGLKRVRIGATLFVQPVTAVKSEMWFRAIFEPGDAAMTEFQARRLYEKCSVVSLFPQFRQLGT